MTGLELFAVGLVAVAGGAVNALAGGGTLITFPMLTAVGVPVVASNITNTVALCPGYLGATFAQMKDLRGQSLRLWLLLLISVLGGIGGGFLLLNTGDQTWFRTCALVMAVGALAGGALGGRFAGRIRPLMLRRIVVTVGIIVAMIYLVR